MSDARGYREPFGTEAHVVLGVSQEEYDRLLRESRQHDGDGVDVSQDPAWHCHPVLGITGHLHGTRGARLHTHLPEWQWDSSNPVFLDGASG